MRYSKPSFTRRRGPAPGVSVEADRHQESRLLPQSRRLPVGLPRPYPGPRIHPADRPRALLRRLHDQLEVQRLPGNPRPHLRPSLRAGLPAQPRRGRDPGEGQEGAGRDLPPQARRRRLQGRRGHQGQHAQGAGEERQAHRLHRRRPRLAHRGARSRRAGLRDRHLRPGSQARRLHPHPDPAFPPARVGDRRGSGLHHRHRQHRVPPQEDRLDEGGPGRRLRRGVRRLRRAARPRSRRARPQGSGRQHPYRPRLAVVGLVRPHQQGRQARDRAGRRQHGDGLLPHRPPPRRRGRQGDRPLRLRGDEGARPGRRKTRWARTSPS